MLICYIDEAGCTGRLPSATAPIQPVLVIAGVIVDQTQVRKLTKDWLDLKRRFFPRALSGSSHYLSHILAEIKGAEVRRDAALGNRNQRRHAIGFLDHFLRLLEDHRARIVGRVWIKGIGAAMDGQAVYTYSMQAMCEYFQNMLVENEERGLVIADSRVKNSNAAVSYSIFTRVFQARGDSYGRLLEMPTFGHSENHAGIQIADTLCSGLLFPMAVDAYCQGHVQNLHVRPRYRDLRVRFGVRVKALQYRYLLDRRWRGGITVSDRIGNRPGGLLFA